MSDVERIGSAQRHLRHRRDPVHVCAFAHLCAYDKVDAQNPLILASAHDTSFAKGLHHAGDVGQTRVHRSSIKDFRQQFAAQQTKRTIKYMASQSMAIQWTVLMYVHSLNTGARIWKAQLDFKSTCSSSTRLQPIRSQAISVRLDSLYKRRLWRLRGQSQCST